MRIGDTCAYARTNVDDNFSLIRDSSAGCWCDVPLKLWPGEGDCDSKDPLQEQTAGVPEPTKTLVRHSSIAIDVA